jgi:hypothetical protein
MPKMRTMREIDPQAERGVGWLAFALAITAAAAYVLVWYLLQGDDGCGPPGHSTAGRIFAIAPFVLPFAAAGILLAFGLKRRWRVLPLSWGAITIIVISGMLEVFVLLEIGVHRCTQ